jgi:hypothetical protein
LILKKNARLILSAVCVLLISQSAVAADWELPYGIDDRLTVSVAAAGHQSFQDTDLVALGTTAVLDFDNINRQDQGCLSWILRKGFDPNTGEGEQIEFQTVDPVDPSAYPFLFAGYGPGDGREEAPGLECYSAELGGGASATGYFVQVNGEWTLRFLSKQEYVGFWWSSGNDQNYVQLLDQFGNEFLDPVFSAESLRQTIFGSLDRFCVENDQVNPYCGNPNLEFQESWQPLDYEPGATFKRGNPYQPYAYIHIRVRDGFYGIKFSGEYFEFDNLTIADVEPARGSE